ncbi:AraC family transcriptional regulator [Marinactinospora rubrisoli]|uniref:AraC family transcriptional regulator n=1 Tax=Marinactinospora rubrisoli TaxID=2715399 RepID=A0ABW2KD42_9ACTN
MMRKVFDSRDLPEAERVPAWREVTASALVPHEIEGDPGAEFLATLRAVRLAEAQVTGLMYSTLTSRRSAKLIRRCDPQLYVVCLILGGRQTIVQEHRAAPLRGNDLVLYSSWHPYQGIVEAPCGGATSVVVQFPRECLPLPADRVSRIMATRLTGREGVGAILAGCLTRLATETGPYRPADAQRLGPVLLDLITAWLAHHIEEEARTPAETRERVRFLEIQAFILRNLGAADLKPSTIAAAHHMSLRSLHRLFQRNGNGVTVAEYVRSQRLTRARRDLADPRNAGRPVQAIAARWGFSRPADFTRAFRSAFGPTPTEYRHACLRVGAQR